MEKYYSKMLCAMLFSPLSSTYLTLLSIVCGPSGYGYSYSTAIKQKRAHCSTIDTNNVRHNAICC